MEKKITQENFEETYVDSIELERIDKFVCDEMARQIHRYIKAMKGSKTIMLKFEEQLATLTVEEKEEAIARYIDLNAKCYQDLTSRLYSHEQWPTIATHSLILSSLSTTSARWFSI